MLNKLRIQIEEQQVVTLLLIARLFETQGDDDALESYNLWQKIQL